MLLTMNSDLAETQGLDVVRQLVRRTICEQNDLETAAAPMTERMLVRQGKACGVLFCVNGPRSVTFTAIWDQAQNVVLFYDSTGKSRQRTKL
jgi:hypothetical protein